MEPFKIKRIGPIWKLEGGNIFLSPFETKPLEDYSEDKAIPANTPLLLQIQERAKEWFDEFPECCETHKNLKSLSNFSKVDYAFIPDQIVNNLKYFSHSLEFFIGKKDWFMAIKLSIPPIKNSLDLVECFDHCSII